MRLKSFSRLSKVILAVFWIILIAVCAKYKDSLTVDTITELLPENELIKFLLMILLFLIKSITFMYGGILYAASGIIYPLPMAVLMNTIGTGLMVIMPFIIGKYCGSGLVEQINNKYPKTAMLKELQSKNEFVISAIARIIGILPTVLVGMYFGAGKMSVKNYFFGSMVGLFPSILCFSVMGMKIEDKTSPEFIISAAFEILLMLISLTAAYLWRRKKRERELKSENRENEFACNT